jgi:outer membrane protein assembly factor BamC
MHSANPASEINNVTSFAIFIPRLTSTRTACALLALALGGCSSVENFMGGDKIDYRSAAVKTNGLDVPPDLTQLARDTRYPQQGGTVSATTFQAAPAASAPSPAASGVLPASTDIRLERLGNERWLAVGQSPDQVWPQLQAFWKERGMILVIDQANAGVMETDWAENRAKLPQDFIRNTLGRLIEPLYSTGERDKFRTRVERVPSGSEIYISHRGLIEVYTSALKEATVWQPRPTDPQLEAEFLQRLMVKLGTKEEAAKAAVVAAAAQTQPAKARLVEGQAAATLQVDDGFDRAWRRVGLALDRSGFTVEDRDRAQGVYFVRYVDPAFAGREDPSFLSKLFSFGRDKGGITTARYRVNVKGEGERSTVAVSNDQGAPENGDAGKRIVALLLEDLK